MALDKLNKGLIYTDSSRCIGCNNCIRKCPELTSNVTIIDENGKSAVHLDDRECILCGTCLDTCTHDVRRYFDDCENFISDLKWGKQISVLIAPAFWLNYPDEYGQILGYLKSLGVNKFYNVSFGADITAWAYVNYITQNKNVGKISQPCPVVVNYIEKHQVDLLDMLIPVQSPMMCTAIYLKRYLGVNDSLAFLSPCIAKKIEIESPRGMGLISYNVTFNNLMRHIKDEDIAIEDYPIQNDEIDYGMGALFSVPGGLCENVEFYLGKEKMVIQAEGEQHVYGYLNSLSRHGLIRRQKPIPTLIDALNCSRGCNYGTGTQFRHTNNDFVKIETHKLRKQKYNTQSTSQRLADLNEKFKHLNIEHFMCKYENKKVPRRYIFDAEIDAVYASMLKTTDENRHIDCRSCGYNSCGQMITAIILGINHKENCVHYVKEALHLRDFYEKRKNVRVAEERLKAMLDSSPLACFIADDHFNILEANQETVNLFGLKDKQEYIDNFFYLSPNYQPDGRHSGEKLYEKFKLAFDIGRAHFEWMYHSVDETLIPCEVTLVRVSFGDKASVIAYIRDLREISAAVSMMEQLKELAFTDALTGAHNRRYFMEQAQEQLQNCIDEDIPFSLIMIDIDHFKSVNDTFGHTTGDEVLRIMVERICQTLAQMPNTLVARYGGEEFVVMITGSNHRDVVKDAWGIQKAIAASPFIIKDLAINVTISLGVASKADPKATLLDIINQADDALYSAKRAGRNTVVSY